MRRALFALCLVTSLTAAAASAENWPRFRGPTGQGVSAETNLPTKWSATENIAWQAPVPFHGWSSPIVWGDKVFLSGTSSDGVSCHVMAYDANTGKQLWDVEVFRQTPTKKEQRNSYATPTPVTDGQHVFAVFSSGWVAALTVDGKPLWTNQEHRFYSQHGLGASPILYEDVLILPFDHSADTGDLKVGWQKPWDKSFVVAFNKSDGKVKWKTGRVQSRISHITPQVVKVDGQDQLVSPAGDVIQGFDPKDGRLLWQADANGEGVVPSVVIADGVIFHCPGFGGPGPVAVRAFKLGGSGNVTKSNLVWEQNKLVPNIPTPLYHDGILYILKENPGFVAAFDARTGQEIWRQRVEGNYWASPTFADGKIYVTNEQAVTTVFAPGREYKELAKNELNGERTQASLAVSGGKLFLRTEKTLFCIK